MARLEGGQGMYIVKPKAYQSSNSLSFRLFWSDRIQTTNQNSTLYAIPKTKLVSHGTHSLDHWITPHMNPTTHMGMMNISCENVLKLHISFRWKHLSYGSSGSTIPLRFSLGPCSHQWWAIKTTTAIPIVLQTIVKSSHVDILVRDSFCDIGME